MIRCKEVKTIDQLRDSRLLYDKKMPAFGYIIIIVILLFLTSVVIMSLNISKVYVVKSPGNVRSNDKNYVMSSFSGKIYDVNIEEGKNVQKGDVLFKVKSTDLNLQKQQLEGQKSIYENQIDKYRKLVKSIKNDINYFYANNAEDNLYYSQYELYKNQIAQQTVDVETYKLCGYTDAQINNELEKSKNKVQEIKNSSIKSAEDAVLQAQCQLDSINAQVAALESGQEEYVVTANETGNVHMLSQCKEGVVVQAASPLASIASDNEEYMIEAYVSASDVVRIEKGDDVDIAVSGLSQTQYGTIHGVVENIDTDITTSQYSEGKEAQSYFKVDIKPKSSFLMNKNGDKVELNNGMTVETRIQYDKVTYFEYILDSLGVLAK